MKKNVFDEIPANLPAELISVLAENEGVRVERIVSDGHSSDAGFWYDQAEDEWVLLLAGSAVLLVEDKRVELGVGNHLFIPAHQRHRVESTSLTEKTIWLAVFSKQKKNP